jgi:hypothetical protein
MSEMSSTPIGTDKKVSQSSKVDERNYLEKKYGKEPKISKDELEKIRWTWH